MRVFGIRVRYLLVPVGVALWYLRKRPLGRPAGSTSDVQPLHAVGGGSRSAGVSAPATKPATKPVTQPATRPASAPKPVPAATPAPKPASTSAPKTKAAPAPKPKPTPVDEAAPAAAPAVKATVPDGPYGPGSALPLDGGAAPSPEFTIKGNASSMLYHTPTSPYYGRTKAEMWFRTEDDAKAAGFTAWVPKRKK